jgi:glycosyltransferase involved in cell wall biosynthesis
MAPRLTVYILGNYRPGMADGLAEFNFQNVKALKHSVNFHFVEFDNSENLGFYNSEIVDEVQIHCFGSKSLSQFKLSPDFERWLKNISTDYVLFHLNHIYNFNNYLAARLLKQLKIPYLFTPHDSYVYCKEFRLSRSWPKRIYRDIFVHFIDKYVLDNASHIHALTNQCIPCLRLLTSGPISVVGNQVDDMNLPLNVSKIENRICFIGRSDIYQKGIDRVLKGFSLFVNSQIDRAKISFTIVGPADQDSDQKRNTLCRDLKLVIGSQVIFTGRVEESERNQILSSSKAYIHLSRFEGFGLSVIQALSASKPVIISTQVPTSDLINTYKAGIVVNSTEEIAEAIAIIFALSEEAYLQMAQNARRCYLEQFHPDVIKPKLLDLYKMAASGSHKPSLIE